MEVTTLCAVIACFQVLPNRSQFFQYESVSLSVNCDQQGNPDAWTVKRNTSKQINSPCPSYSTERKESTCVLNDLYESDSGVYWCESEAVKGDIAINITVTNGELILESPALPVMEDEDLILQCRTRKTFPKNLPTEFYKDELRIGNSLTRNITLQRVSKADEGFYKCYIYGVGESPYSWLSVKARLPELPHSNGNIGLPVMVTSVSVSVVMLLYLWITHQDKCDSTIVLYTVIIKRTCI